MRKKHAWDSRSFLSSCDRCFDIHFLLLLHAHAKSTWTENALETQVTRNRRNLNRGERGTLCRRQGPTPERELALDRGQGRRQEQEQEQELAQEREREPAPAPAPDPPDRFTTVVELEAAPGVTLPLMLTEIEPLVLEEIEDDDPGVVPWLLTLTEALPGTLLLTFTVGGMTWLLTLMAGPATWLLTLTDGAVAWLFTLTDGTVAWLLTLMAGGTTLLLIPIDDDGRLLKPNDSVPTPPMTLAPTRQRRHVRAAKAQGRAAAAVAAATERLAGPEMTKRHLLGLDCGRETNERNEKRELDHDAGSRGNGVVVVLRRGRVE